jgi:hypothetical protein
MRRSERLRALDVLAGEWTSEASLDGRVLAWGRMTASWIEDGAFLVLRADAEVVPEWREHTPFPTTTVIGADDHSGTFTHAYADARGVSRVYAMTLADGRWEVAGRPGADFHQRFSADVTATAVDGRWERSADGRAWDLDFDLRYARVT